MSGTSHLRLEAKVEALTEQLEGLRLAVDRLTTLQGRIVDTIELMATAQSDSMDRTTELMKLLAQAVRTK